MPPTEPVTHNAEPVLDAANHVAVSIMSDAVGAGFLFFRSDSQNFRHGFSHNLLQFLSTVRFSYLRASLLSAHCGYSGSIFDFFVIEERPVMPGPLFFTGISTSLSFWEPSSLCRHQKRPCISTLMQGLCSYGMQHLNFDLLLTAPPSVQARSGRNAVYGSALALSWNRPEHFAAVC